MSVRIQCKRTLFSQFLRLVIIIWTLRMWLIYMIFVSLYMFRVKSLSSSSATWFNFHIRQVHSGKNMKSTRSKMVKDLWPLLLYIFLLFFAKLQAPCVIVWLIFFVITEKPLPFPLKIIKISLYCAVIKIQALMQLQIFLLSQGKNTLYILCSHSVT